MKVINILYKYPFLTIIITVLTMLCFSIEYLEVSIMEARNFVSAREMVLDGNWLLTTLNGEDRFEKPPLPSWLTAISGMLFGFKNLLALRFPAILMIAVLGMCIYSFSKELHFDAKSALNNSLIAITSFYIIAVVIEAPSDIFTYTFSTFSVFYLLKIFNSPSENLRQLLLAGLLLGLSILSKGPVPIYTVLTPFLLAYIFAFGVKNSKYILLASLKVLIIGLLIGGSWYMFVWLEKPDAFVERSSLEIQNWKTFNVKPFYYYWSFFTQSGIWSIFALIALFYPFMKSRVSNIKNYKFTFYWTIITVILLSFIPEKKSRYLVPVLIPLAINSGFLIEYLFKNYKHIGNSKENLVLNLNFLIISLLGISFPFIAFIFFSEYLNVSIIQLVLPSFTLFFLGFLILIYLFKSKIPQVFYLTILFMIGAFITVLPLNQSLKNRSYKSESSIYKEFPDLRNVSIYGYELSPETFWHFGEKIKLVKAEESESAMIIPDDNTFALLAARFRDEDKLKLAKQFHMKLLSNYDLNTQDIKSEGYKKRLATTLYLLKKK